MQNSSKFVKTLIISALIGVFAFANSSAYKEEPSNLSDEEYDIFMLGKSFFRIPWVEAPSATTARDGLGPLFNANTCTSCHPGNGRGAARKDDGELDRSVIIKLASLSRKDEKNLVINGVVGDAVYGTQLQVNGVFGVPFEATPTIEVQKFYVIYPGGEIIELEKPILNLSNFGYGKIDNNTVITMRLAQPLVGMGLIDEIDAKDILSYEDPYDKNGDGISGRANYVYSREAGEIEIGKFNWKAQAPSLKAQIAQAFSEDMGITNELYPLENCMPMQKECLRAPNGKDELDITSLRLEAVRHYVANLKLPAQNITKTNGEKIFNTIGCASCHRPSYTLESGKSIFPYSDFLLHDMGPNLADKRGEFLASGSEWRTQPLWGIKYAKDVLKKKPRYLHDGRARSLEEAILWHGGEAARANLNFVNLSKDEKKELIEFLKEL